MHERLPPTHEPWLSRRHWRRLVEAYAAGRITRDQLAALKRRLARVRTGAEAAGVPLRPRPALRLLEGGARRALPRQSPFSPNPQEAA
jgi:hypothetical protein